jgi:hypothetical protein
MWCSTCHQDVPAIANPASGRLVCSRCQHPLTGAKARAGASICDVGIALDETEIIAPAPVPPIRVDDFAARRHARALDRKLRPALHTHAATGFTPHATRRFDPPQNLFDHLDHVAAPTVATPTQSAPASAPRPRDSAGAQTFAWLVVLASTIVLATGVGLIGWSLSAKQMQYWNLAIGLALGGQGGLILGLVLVVSRLWRNSRYATHRLQDVNARLGELQRTADALTAMRSGGAPTFYADLARGASPQMLLSNLKGQLDHLASRLGGR